MSINDPNFQEEAALTSGGESNAGDFVRERKIMSISKDVSTNSKPINSTVDLISENNIPNRKVVFASFASAIGSLVSIFVATVIFVTFPGIPDEDKGTIKASLAAVVTSVITLVVGYYTLPAHGDGTKTKES